MNQARRKFRMSDASPDILTRLAPEKLTFHWKSASIYTTVLGAAIALVFVGSGQSLSTFTPDHVQAGARLACLIPLLIFCFTAIAIQRLMPYGVIPGAVFLVTALSFWIDISAASLYYGVAVGLGAEWVKTALMALTTLGVLLTTLSGALFGYRARRQERTIADRDALTGLLNRTGLLRRYAALTPGTPCTLVVFDLNRLKAINDASGHGAGDAYIRAQANTIRVALADHGDVARWGGDEFVAILPYTSEQQVAETIETLLSTAPRADHNLPAFAYGTTTLTATELLERPLALADQKMYECKELQRENRTQLVREINAVEEISRELELLHTSEDLLNTGLPLIAQLLRFDATFYIKRLPDAWTVEAFHAFSNTETHSSLPVSEGVTYPFLEGIIGRAYREGRTVYSTDYPSDPDASSAWIEAGLKTTLATPVRCLGEIVGFVCLASVSTWRSVTPQVRRMTETIGLRLGHVFDLERTEQNVRSTLEGGLLGLGAALEARDLETGGHTRRVVEHATKLGESLGLPAGQLEDLRQGAYLHDIGKLVIPDAILLKPGRLTPTEWEIMKSHASEGAKIARTIPTLTKGAISLIRYHHERWDGTGYPDALSGTTIPLPARIFAVCDVYDALTSDRPYKQAWPAAEAKLEIARQAGRQFDPEVVQAFLQLAER
ncbi:HD domain-containing phosphohydrolase [Deinococcus altitudinis]|uniref:HD domain-containing phosphohydrolase n=1 Tax=Deinococcus altitudinis TaxID=468914 RepID=UPI00389199A7